ncbi:hypothetical protein ES703_73164 [subsurface metagenome]
MIYHYEAGFFDGEGSITIQRAQPPRQAFKLYVAITSNNWEQIELYQHWGGRLYTYETGIRQHGETGIRKTRARSYALFFERDEAEVLLKDLLPFLRLKHKQAEVALEFIEAYRRLSPLRVKTGRRGRPPYTGQELKLYQELYDKMRGLNLGEDIKLS